MVSVISAREAVEKIGDGSTVVLGGSSGIACPESILREMEQRFLEEGHPKDLFAVHSTGLGDRESRGIIHLAHEGLLKRVLTGHYGLQPQIAKMARENKVEAYNFPQGPLTQLYREIAAHHPGVITHVGWGTYMDPRVEGGKMNARTTEDLVSLVTIEGTEWMLYKSFPIHVAILRGTTADEDGNITMEHECSPLEVLAQAEAAHNSGGIVIVEVKRLAKSGTLDPRMVKIPGILVDYVVVDPEPMMTWKTKFDASYCGEVKKPLGEMPPLPLDVRKVIARRAAMELKKGDVANVGAGISDKVPAVATEEGLIQDATFTIEAGIVGGTGGTQLDFGTATNPVAIIDQPYMFDFYDGGGLDIAFLSFVECDPRGNINVTKLSGQIEGPGGFMDISGNAKQINFLGTFSAGGLQVELKDGEIHIVKEGKYMKFFQEVSHLSWNAEIARQKGQKAVYITERAVFELAPEGIVLKEVAPGIDLQKDILEHMPFQPILAEDLKQMDPRIFREALMGLAEDPERQN